MKPKPAQHEEKWYEAVMREAIESDRDRVKNMCKIDDIVENKWEPPASLAALPHFRVHKTTAPFDAVNAADRVLSTLMPKIDICPQRPDAEEYSRIERIEQVLGWNYAQMNRRGSSYPLWDIVDNALRYMVVAFQVEYLPFQLKGKDDPRTKELLRRGAYLWRVHNAKNVHAKKDNYGPISITATSIESANAMVERFGSDNRGVKKMLRAIEKGAKDAEKGSVVNGSKIALFDYTDYKDRAIKGVIYNNEDLETIVERDGFWFVLEGHGLPFLNWVYREGGTPLLQSVVDADLYDNTNIALSLEASAVIATVAHPGTKSKTYDGRSPNIDYTNPSGNVPLKPGEELDSMQSRQMDPYFSQYTQGMVSAIHGTTVTRTLKTLEFSGNMAFSSINAILQMAVSSISPQRRLCEIAHEDGLYLCLKWINHAEEPASGYRLSTKNVLDPLMQRGQPMSIQPMSVGQPPPGGAIADPDTLDIRVELRTDTPTDKQQRINNAMNLSKALKYSTSRALEMVGEDNAETIIAEWEQEQLDSVKLGNKLKTEQAKGDAAAQKIMMDAQLAAQKAMQGGQQGGQGQPGGPQQGPPPGPSQFMSAQGQGFNPGMGGQPAQEVAPGTGREQLNGETMDGQALA